MLSFSFLIYGLPPEQASEKLHVIAYGSEKGEEMERFMALAKAKSLSVSVIKCAKTPKPGQKIYDLKKHLRTLPAHDVVLILEPRELLIFESESAILSKFKSFNAGFVVAAEKFCPIFYELADEFPPSPYGFRYPCSMAYIGYVGAVLELLQTLAPKVALAEENELMLLDFLKHESKYCLDYNCQLFMPLAGVDEASLWVDVENQQLGSYETKATPSLVMGEGSGLYVYEWIVDQLTQGACSRDAI